MKDDKKKNKIITIDLDNKEIHTSNIDVKNLLLSSKKCFGNAFNSFDFSAFNVVDKLEKNRGKTVGDKLTLSDIKKYIKENKPDLTKELDELINTQAKDKKGNLLFKKDGKTPKRISFLEIKKWFYKNCPTEAPKK